MSEITGMPVTNAIYPTATALNPNVSVNGLPPRIHNLPATFLADLVHQTGTNNYFAWVYVNFAMALIVAVAVYFIARSQGYSSAFIAPAFFLSFPLTLWLSINALAEMSLALGSCVLMLGATVVSRAVTDEGQKASIGLSIIAGGSILMFYTRDNYALLFPSLVLFTFWVCRSNRKRWVTAVPILAITALLMAMKRTLLPQYPNAGILSLLMGGAKKEEMSPYFSLGHAPFSVSELFTKMTNGLRDALLPSGLSELVTELPIIIIVVVSLVVLRKNDKSSILRFWMVVVMVIYLVTSTIFQSQNRYIFALVPFVAVFAAGLWDRINQHNAELGSLVNVIRVAAVCFMIICISGSFLMARTYRIEATAQVAQTTKLIAGLAGEPSGSVLAAVDSSKLLPLTYAAVPRPVLAVNPRINSTADAVRLIETWKVRVLVGASDTDFQYFSEAVNLAFAGRAKLISQASYGTPGGPIRLWRIELGSA